MIIARRAKVRTRYSSVFVSKGMTTCHSVDKVDRFQDCKLCATGYQAVRNQNPINVILSLFMNAFGGSDMKFNTQYKSGK